MIIDSKKIINIGTEAWTTRENTWLQKWSLLMKSSIVSKIAACVLFEMIRALLKCLTVYREIGS